MSYTTSAYNPAGMHTYNGGEECAVPPLGLAGKLAATTAVVLAALAPQGMQVQAYHAPKPTSSTTGQHTPVEYAASTTSWDNPSESLLYRVMSTPVVADFKRLVPTADMGAVQGIFDLALKHFGGTGRLDTRFDLEQEESGPALFLSLDTHGMGMDEQLNREVAMREAIWQDARLREAKQHVVINVY